MDAREEVNLSVNGREEPESLFEKQGYADYKWIEPEDIVVAQWVRLKCTFGCAEYGRNASCPPNVLSVPESRQFFNDYSAAVILHFEKTVDKREDRHAW